MRKKVEERENERKFRGKVDTCVEPQKKICSPPPPVDSTGRGFSDQSLTLGSHFLFLSLSLSLSVSLPFFITLYLSLLVSSSVSHTRPSVGCFPEKKVSGIIFGRKKFWLCLSHLQVAKSGEIDLIYLEV